MPPSRRPQPRRSQTGRSQTGRSGARPTRPLTDAERRAAEVRARRGPRPPRSPDADRDRADTRSVETWIDEGSLRDEAEGAARRATRTTNATRRPRQAPSPDPVVAAELTEVVGAERGRRLAERLAHAADALDRGRFDEARRTATAIIREVPTVAAAHEIVGLANYRLGRYKAAARALETSADLHADVTLLPVLADCYRALRRWSAVDRVWLELREASPAPFVMAEGRIVVAGALADRGRLRDAVAMMEPATKRPRRVQEYHLRQWYVIADLYDRLGDAITARRWFATIADLDPTFADVDDRLRAIGR